jgi:hypothetical protein
VYIIEQDSPALLGCTDVLHQQTHYEHNEHHSAARLKHNVGAAAATDNSIYD